MAVVTTIAKFFFSFLTFAEDSQFSSFHVRKPDAGFNLGPESLSCKWWEHCG
jgi:hypothetical protein